MDDLTTEDVLTVCRSGAIIMAPEKDIKTRSRQQVLSPFTTASFQNKPLHQALF